MSCTADFDCLNKENPFSNLGWNGEIHDPEPELENIFSYTIARKNKSEINGRSTPFQVEKLPTNTRDEKENNIATGFKDSKSRSASDSSEYQRYPLFLIKDDLKREFESIINFSLPDYSYYEKVFEYLVSSFEEIGEEDFWSPCSPFTLDLEEFFLINLYEGNTEVQTSISDYFFQRKEGNITIKFLYPLDQIVSKVRHTFDLNHIIVIDRKYF